MIKCQQILTLISMVDFTYESYKARKVYIMFSNLVVEQKKFISVEHETSSETSGPGYERFGPSRYKNEGGSGPRLYDGSDLKL